MRGNCEKALSLLKRESCAARRTAAKSFAKQSTGLRSFSRTSGSANHRATAQPDQLSGSAALTACGAAAIDKSSDDVSWRRSAAGAEGLQQVNESTSAGSVVCHGGIHSFGQERFERRLVSWLGCRQLTLAVRSAPDCAPAHPRPNKLNEGVLRAPPHRQACSLTQRSGSLNLWRPKS